MFADVDTALDEQISGSQRLTDARHHQDVHADVEHAIDASLDLVPQAGFGVKERLDIADDGGGSGEEVPDFGHHMHDAASYGLHAMPDGAEEIAAG